MIHGRLARFSFAFCNYHNNKFPKITNGYFALPDLDTDSDSDSDCELNRYIVPSRTFHIARSRDSDFQS